MKPSDSNVGMRGSSPGGAVSGTFGIDNQQRETEPADLTPVTDLGLGFSIRSVVIKTLQTESARMENRSCHPLSANVSMVSPDSG